MKHHFLQIFVALLLWLNLSIGFAQQKPSKVYWQQQVNYSIDVTLDDKAHSLDGFEEMNYTNNSPDTLHFIWIHLWMNAYKNDASAFSEQLLTNRSTDFYFSNEEQRGYINRLDFKVDGKRAELLSHPKFTDVAKLMLPEGLASGSSIKITTPFHVKLPYNFSRGGHIDQTYQITQWYPKPAVYDTKGWHEMTYLDQGEFYSEFGDYNINIKLPSNYVVASTGVLQNSDKLQSLKTLGKTPIMEQHIYKRWEAYQHEKVVISKKGKMFTPKKKPFSILSDTSFTTWNFKQSKVHDFAWFAAKTFVVQFDTLQLNSKTIDVFSFFYPDEIKSWARSIAVAKKGLNKYSSWIGEYPYNTASMVMGKTSEKSDGMEYPTITLIDGSKGNGDDLEETIVHELGHNWLYGALANNERDHPWMDESINTYYTNRYMNEVHGSSSDKTLGILNQVLINTLAGIQKDQPIDTNAEAYTSLNYEMMVYNKGSLWMNAIENKFGKLVLDKGMQGYYQNWVFKHPYPSDFKTSFEQSSGKEIDSFFQALYSTGRITPAINGKKTLRIRFLYPFKNLEEHNTICWLPFAGYNNYDKWMWGGLIHNYSLPLRKWQYVSIPLYATGTNTINYFGRVSYNIYQRSGNWQFSNSIAKYTYDKFTAYDGTKVVWGLKRIVPSVQYTLYNKDIRSTDKWTFLARTFLLWKDTSYSTTQKNPAYTMVNELSAIVSNNRILYPYTFNLTMHQGHGFARLGFTGNYFFNYSKAKGGVNARIFAGKFFYVGAQPSFNVDEPDKYKLNMTGPKADEDYTFSNYYIGRSDYDGWKSQQIMERDGFFKVNTDHYFTKAGKSDDWLVAMNITARLPDKYNPLQLLPFKLPLYFFLDVGTYAEAWKDQTSSTSTGRMLYDGGLQLSIFKDAVQVYFPLAYSSVYSDYYKSVLGNNNFWKTVSFSINLQKLQPNRFVSEFPL